MAQPNKATGNAATAEVPEPKTKPKFISSEEAKKFEKLLQKDFVPKDGKDKDKFFYRPISIIPYSRAGESGGVNENLYKFLLQKYHRNKTQKVSVNDGKGGRETIEDNQPVEGHRMSGEGFWECVDPSAAMTIDVQDFKDMFVADKDTE